MKNMRPMLVLNRKPITKLHQANISTLNHTALYHSINIKRWRALDWVDRLVLLQYLSLKRKELIIIINDIVCQKKTTHFIHPGESVKPRIQQILTILQLRKATVEWIHLKAKVELAKIFNRNIKKILSTFILTKIDKRTFLLQESIKL